MYKIVKITLFLCLYVFISNAQNVGINASGTSPNSSAGLDIDFNNKGLLIPRIALTSATDVSTISSPSTSLLIYNTATAGTSPNNVTPGFYYFDGTNWERVKTGIKKKFLPSDVASSSTTLADVTGLSFDVLNGQTYKFRFFIVYTASATSVGSRWTLNGPTTTRLTYFSTYPSSTSANAFYHQAGYNTASATANSGSTGGNVAIIEGIITPSADGTVIARIAAESATITAKAAISFVEWELLSD